MTKILLTGANGYIGNHVISALLKTVSLSDIIAVDISNSHLPDDIHYIKHDILGDSENPDIYKILGKPDVCIHLAWQDGFNHNAQSHLKNVHAHYQFLKNIIEQGCQSVSVMGTMHEIGYYEGCIDENTPCHPLSMYGVAKNTLRQALNVFLQNKENVSFKWLRAFYITGDDTANKSVFSKIIQMEGEGKNSFPFTSGENKYDFQDVNMLAEQIVVASLQNEINGIINICSGKPVALKDKVEEFIQKNNFKIRPEYGAFPSRKYDSPAIWGNADKINKIMGN